MMRIMQCLTFLVAFIQIVQGCRFPVHMRDSWFSGSSLDSVVIGSNSITRKGVCFEKYQNLYLVESKEGACYTCLKIEERHENILQYQESHCGDKINLQQACAGIISSIWHTLFRENYKPSPCPFQDAYHFGYTNNSGGFCRHPASTAKACASESQYRFHFRHCSTLAYTYERDSDLICIGNWEDNGQMYLAAQFTLSSKEDMQKGQQYRCLIYKLRGTLLYVAMSADASCRGLQTARNGPVVMEMTKDVFSFRGAECTFPHWHPKERWRDLSGHLVYSMNSNQDTIHQLYRNEVFPGAHTDTKKSFRCQEILEREHGGNSKEILALTFSSHNCTSYYQCIKYSKRREGILEITEGKLRSFENACTDDDFEPFLSKTILINLEDDEYHRSYMCPVEGRFLIHTGSNRCKSYLRSGCNASDTSVIDIKSTCATKAGMQLTCLKSWRHNGVRYLIGRRLDDPHGPTNCFSFRRVLNGLEFGVDPLCNSNTPYIFSKTPVLYTIDAQPVDCIEPSVPSTSIIISNHNALHEEDERSETLPNVIKSDTEGHHDLNKNKEGRKERDQRTKPLSPQIYIHSGTSTTVLAMHLFPMVFFTTALPLFLYVFPVS